jgi:hypothetical protein
MRFAAEARPCARVALCFGGSGGVAFEIWKVLKNGVFDGRNGDEAAESLSVTNEI